MILEYGSLLLVLVSCGKMKLCHAQLDVIGDLEVFLLLLLLL